MEYTSQLKRDDFIESGHENLRCPGSVVMSLDISNAGTFDEDIPYMIHLSVTGRCNAHCRGCINSAITFKYDPDGVHFSEAYDVQPQRDARAIGHLLTGQNKHYAVVCLYGGEPLLVCDKILKTTEFVPLSTNIPVRYMLYTNGQLLVESIHNYPRLFERLWLASISIDGQKHQHELYRPGTDLVNIHRGLRCLSQYPKVSVMMWSTLREGQSLTNCLEEFLYLYEHGLAEHWFYHWVETPEPFNDFGRCLREYETQLRQIIHIYLEFLSLGRILSIVHISELVLYLLTGKQRGTTACGVENARNYDLAGGKILACADLGPDWAIGTISDDGKPLVNEKELSRLIGYKKELGCYSCGIHAYCGGRCPVQAVNSSKERLVQYCQVMRLHVAVVKEYISAIWQTMQQHGITLQRLYDYSAYYAQFTDVTP